MKPDTTSTAAPAPSVTTSGGGTFVLEAGGVRASVKLPADRKRQDVANVRTFLRRAKAPSLRIASVTVKNDSSRPFVLSGFEVHTTSGSLKLYPVATYVNLAMALPGAGAKPDLATAASQIALTSVTKVPAGQEVTTLIGTTEPLGRIVELVYRQGSTTTRLLPLWQVRAAG